jgi:hypothetical protein
MPGSELMSGSKLKNASPTCPGPTRWIVVCWEAVGEVPEVQNASAVAHSDSRFVSLVIFFESVAGVSMKTVQCPSGQPQGTAVG